MLLRMIRFSTLIIIDSLLLMLSDKCDSPVVCQDVCCSRPAAVVGRRTLWVLSLA